jgi:hypothetical protein
MRILVLALAVLALGTAPATAAELGVAIDRFPDRVVTFGVDRPGTALSGPTTITGILTANEHPVAIDFRPSTNELYMLAVDNAGDSGHIYKLDPITGVATAVGGTKLGMVGAFWDIDFDPVADRIRALASDLDGPKTHRTYDPATGNAGPNDTLPEDGPGDPQSLGAGAYTNSVPGATSRTMFAMTNVVLVRMGSPNGTPDSAATGKLTAIGGFVQDSVSCYCESLDISGATGRAYTAVNDLESPNQFTNLTLIDLATAATRQLGRTPLGFSTDIAIARTSLFSVAPGPVATAEAGGQAAFIVRRVGPGTGAARVSYQPVAGSATAGSDFTAAAGSVSFGAGETSKTIVVPVARDGVDERAETFSLRLTSAAGSQREGAELSGATVATTTIADPITSASGFRMTNKVFAPQPPKRSSTAAKPRKRAKRGTTFVYRLSENAPVSITVARRTLGRRVGRSCRRATRRLRKRRRCVRYVRSGTIRVRRTRAGVNRTAFSGRFGRRALRRARYRATLVATDASGSKTRPLRLSFRVVRR